MLKIIVFHLLLTSQSISNPTLNSVVKLNPGTRTDRKEQWKDCGLCAVQDILHCFSRLGHPIRERLWQLEVIDNALSNFRLTNWVKITEGLVFG